MAHRQAKEIEEAIHAYWVDPLGELSVCDPDTFRSVSFQRLKQRVWVYAGIHPSGSSAEKALQAMRFESKQRLSMNPKTLEPVPITYWRLEVHTPEAALAAVLGCLPDVMDVGDDDWIYLSHTPNPDEWPHPLPRPD